ncbi:MAG: hypothetical protein CMH57_01315 [Myxococcales bacterium]|nr:hypothetical protein [Myxococcales bacterium]
MVGAALLCALAACGGDEDPSNDAAAGANNDDGILSPGDACVETTLEPPRGTPEELCPSGVFDAYGLCEPLLPNLTPPEGCPGPTADDGGCLPQPIQWTCPAGWLATETFTEAQRLDLGLGEGHTHCVPPALPRDCPPGTAPRLGSDACEPLGVECPTNGDLWHPPEAIRAQAGEGYEGGTILYVQAGATEGGSGTREDPAATLAEAMEMAGSGDIIAIGVGRYVEELRLGSGMAALGACAAQTVIEAPTADEDASTVTFASRGLLSDVTVTGPRVGVSTGLISRVELRAVHVHEAVTTGVRVVGSPDVRLNQVLISDTQLQPSTQQLGSGLVVSLNGTAHLEGVTLLRNHHSGVIVETSSSVTLRDVAVLDTQTLPTPFRGSYLGNGVTVVGGVLDGERVLVEGNSEAGILLIQSGRGGLKDTVVQDTSPQPTEQALLGRGIVVVLNSSLDGERLLSTRNREAGLYLAANSVVDVSDIVATDIESAGGASPGVGILVEQNGELEAERVVCTRNVGAAMGASQSRVKLTDALLTHTASDEAGTSGFGLYTTRVGSHLEVERAWMAYNHNAGAVMDGGDGVLRDVRVSHTQPEANGVEEDAGLAIQQGEWRGDRIVVEDNYGVGLIVLNTSETSTSTAQLRDVVVRGTRPQISRMKRGRGLSAQRNAIVDAERVLLEGNREYGLYAVREGARVTIADLTVRGTLYRELDQDAGLGAVVFNGAQLELQRARIVENQAAGLHIQGEGANARLVDVSVTGTRPRQSNQQEGRGIVVVQNAALEGERIVVTENRDVGLQVVLNSRAQVSDLTVAGTQPREADQLFGFGVTVQQGSRLEGERIRLTQNHLVGLLIRDAETSAQLSDVEVSETYACTVCEAPVGGSGLAVLDEGVAHANRFLLSDNQLVGVQISEGEFVGQQGQITGNFIGLNGTVRDEQVSCVDIHENCCGASCDVITCNVETDALPIPSSEPVVLELSDDDYEGSGASR